MNTYTAPTRDMRFVLNELAGLPDVNQLPGFEEATVETVDAVLEEAGKFAAEVLAPLNRPGDINGAKFNDAEVMPPEGFKDAYRAFVESGWASLPFEPEFGGQGLPELVAAATNEIWQSANMGFALCPMLTEGCAVALGLHGSHDMKAIFLPKLVSGGVGGHHEPDGTTGRVGPGRDQDQGRAQRRYLPHIRTKDLHHLGRP